MLNQDTSQLVAIKIDCVDLRSSQSPLKDTAASMGSHSLFMLPTLPTMGSKYGSLLVFFVALQYSFIATSCVPCHRY